MNQAKAKSQNKTILRTALTLVTLSLALSFQNCGGFGLSKMSRDGVANLNAPHTGMPSDSVRARDQHLVFTHPNSESDLAVDWDQAYDHGAQWVGTLSQTDVIQVWEYDIPSFKQSSIQHLVNLSVLWGSQVGAEMQPLDADGCTAGAPAAQNIQAVATYTANNVIANLAPLYQAGGTLSYAALDSDGINTVINNPNGQNACNFTVAQAIKAQLLFMQQVHVVHPEIKFGLLPNFPNYNYNGTPCFTNADGGGHCLDSFGGRDYAAVLVQQVETIQNAGEQFWFVHVDNPYTYIHNVAGNVDVINDRLMVLEQQVQGLGLRFGVIFNTDQGNITTSTAALDQQYHDETMAYIQAFEAVDQGGEDDLIIESWFAVPGHILPEGTANTFTAIANEAIPLFRSLAGDNASPSMPGAAHDTKGNPLVDGGTYKIRNIGSSQCLDVTGGSRKNGTPIQQFTCVQGDLNQDWIVHINSDNSYSISSVVSSDLLDFAANTLPANGSVVQQWMATGGSNQNFMIVPSSAGGFQLSTQMAADGCLDVCANNLSVVGYPLQTFTCGETSNQAFQFVAVAP